MKRLLADSLRLAFRFLLVLGSLQECVSAQQIEMFPPGPYVSQCRSIDEALGCGGDDDNNNIFFFEVDPLIADGTSLPDFYIHLWDGDSNPTANNSGTLDRIGCGPGGAAVFEYRLYGGVGAAFHNEAPPGYNPSSWVGTLIDIDSDMGDFTLRTDDPDDIDGNDPEDLRDQDFSLIGIDMDVPANKGDLVNGRFIYKFVVDGTMGPGSDWNRYEVQITTDLQRTDQTGVRIFVYELTYAGRPSLSSQFTNVGFRVPSTITQELDIQTLDLDRDDLGVDPTSQLTTGSRFFDDSETYEFR